MKLERVEYGNRLMTLFVLLGKKRVTLEYLASL
jgi:hypothetical protein